MCCWLLLVMRSKALFLHVLLMRSEACFLPLHLLLLRMSLVCFLPLHVQHPQCRHGHHSCGGCRGRGPAGGTLPSQGRPCQAYQRSCRQWWHWGRAAEGKAEAP